jgi:hypothetical protein
MCVKPAIYVTIIRHTSVTSSHMSIEKFRNRKAEIRILLVGDMVTIANTTS